MLNTHIFLLINCIVSIRGFNFSDETRCSINIAEIIPCFENIAKRYYKNTNFLFISEEIYKIDFFNVLLEKFCGTVTIQQKDKFEGMFGFFVLFPERNASYERFLSSIMPFTYNRFLIVWPHLIVNDSEIHEFISQFWKFRLLNVAILSRNSDESFDIHTYDPYSGSYCNRPGPLGLLDVWNITHHSFHHNNDLFPLTKKLKNLNGCKLVCFAKTRPPDAIVKEVEDHTWKLEGIGGKLMEEIRKRINFTPVIKVPKLNVSVDKYGYDISYGFPELITKLLNNHTVDLGFGIYSHIIYDNPNVEFAMTTVSECYGWAVPAHAGKVIPVWMYYTQEFSLAVWFSILLIFTFCTLIFYLMMNTFYPSPVVFKAFNFAIMYIFSLHLGISASPRIKWLKIRVWVLMIILYSLVISSAYQSTLGSFLTVPWQRENIKTFQEIMSANYNIIGVPQGKRILQRFSADNKILKTLSNRFQVHYQHFDSVVLRLHQHKDTATFGAQRFIQFYISNELNGTSRDDIYLLPQCVIQAHASPFLFKKGSPFIKPIDKMISAAVESGLTNFWFTYSTPKISRTLAKIFPLTLQQLKCAFALLIIGNCLAFFLFIWEIKQLKT